ncbi:TraR/DksA C4-type zinc finger protein [candidate division KSB1 bacterium]|nr:TraR/DksA C4-type zinc finger protein [candidate division KSB1 bacterium]RQW07698.1 MAG: molecular chaperone DnaK [candidate division KSB1 bacterium]
MNEKRMTPYSDKELEHFKALILEKKSEAEKEIELLKGQISQDNRGELDNDSGYSFHIADSAAVATGRENIYIMIDRQQKLISYLDRALVRIEQKTYGICRVTGKKIPKERLEAIPHTELSVEGKIEEQHGRRR